MEDIKKQILEILRRDLREEEGKENFIQYLEKTDFFTAPSSTIFHSADDGGLALHSLHVYQLLKEKNERYNLKISPASLAICGLLHDICKTSYYKLEKKFRKLEEDIYDDKGNMVKKGRWGTKDVWVVDDQFPVGHGEKSVIMIQRFLKLKDEEIIAIRWHMGAFEMGVHFNYPSGYPFRLATKSYPLLTAMISADMEASNIIEADTYNPLHKMSEESLQS